MQLHWIMLFVIMLTTPLIEDFALCGEKCVIRVMHVLEMLADMLQ